MRVLLDISVLGLGHAFPEMRGGTFRVHEHLLEGLAHSGRCELTLCANYSSVAFAGCVDYVQSRQVLASLPLISSHANGSGGAGRLTRAVHRAIRPAFRGHVLPAFLRAAAQRVDRTLHHPVRDASPGVDVFHSLGARLPPLDGLKRSPPRIVNIYDLAPLRLPHFYGANHQYLAEERIAGFRQGDWVMTTSESTRRELAALAGVDANRVFVMPLAADPRRFHPNLDPDRGATLRARLGIGSGAYLLALNADDRRKNMDAAIRAFTRAVAEGGAHDLALVVAGPHSADARIGDALAEAARRGARVILAGYVADNDLAMLYAGARAFVYPSLYEGFGLPPLEAMQCGTPVIAGRVASLPEVVGEAGLLVDLSDAGALSEAMLRLHRDRQLRDHLSALSLQRAAMFSWERAVEQTLAAYQTVATAS